MRTLRFPPRHHTVTAGLSIRDIGPLVDDLRRQLAGILRDLAAKQDSPDVRSALLEAAAIFEAIEGPPPETPKVRTLP